MKTNRQSIERIGYGVYNDRRRRSFRDNCMRTYTGYTHGATMRILIVCEAFATLTGGELYVYELARELTRRKHEVTIVSEIGGEITQQAIRRGVRVYSSFNDIPNGLEFDVMHLNQPAPARVALNRFPNVQAVATIHSQFECEAPVVHPNIRKYICVRPEIASFLSKRYGILNRLGGHYIPPDKLVVIYNGIDFSRFNTMHIPPRRQRKTIVFPGSIDILRREAARHLIKRSILEKFDLWFIGDKESNHLERLPPNVTYTPAKWNIETYIKQADETAGILLGRTTIEGWACGKPGWIYDLDNRGRIKAVALHEPPADIDKFDIRNVAAKILPLYEHAIACAR